jgi:hypothetical protein
MHPEDLKCIASGICCSFGGGGCCFFGADGGAFGSSSCPDRSQTVWSRWKPMVAPSACIHLQPKKPVNELIGEFGT